MKTFRVIVRRDAWVNYTADIQAADKIAAAALAEQAWKTGNPSVQFEEDGLTEFDAILVNPDECEAHWPCPLWKINWPRRYADPPSRS